MRRFSFNHDIKKWDTHQCFHASRDGFTEYETGELIIDNPTPANRTGSVSSNNKYGIGITTTRRTFTPLYLDHDCTQPIKPAWLLQGGQQDMALDFEQLVAVRLRGSSSGFGHSYCAPSTKAKHLPKQFYKAQAFWPRAGELPIPLSQFTVSKPDRTLKKRLVDKLDIVRTTVSAAVRMNPPAVKLTPTQQYKYNVKPSWTEMSVSYIVGYLMDGTAYGNHMDRYSIIHNGWDYPRNETQHDFLYFKKQTREQLYNA